MADFERELLQADYEDRSTRHRWMIEAKLEDNRYSNSRSSDVDDLLQWTSKKPTTEIAEDLLDFSIEQQGRKKEDHTRFQDLFAHEKESGDLAGCSEGLSISDMMEATKIKQDLNRGKPGRNLELGEGQYKENHSAKAKNLVVKGKPGHQSSLTRDTIPERFDSLGASEIFLEDKSIEREESIKVKLDATSSGTFSKHTNVNLLTNLAEPQKPAVRDIAAKRVDNLTGYFTTKPTGAQEGETRQVTVVDSRKILKKQDNSKLEAIKAKYRKLAEESKVGHHPANTEENISRKVNVTFDEIYKAFTSASLPEKLDIKDLVWDNRKKKFDIISSCDVLGKREDLSDLRSAAINLTGGQSKYCSGLTRTQRPGGAGFTDSGMRDSGLNQRQQAVAQKSSRDSQPRINQVRCSRKSSERGTLQNKIIPEVEIFNESSGCEDADDPTDLDNAPIGGLALLGGVQGVHNYNFKQIMAQSAHFTPKNASSQPQTREIVIDELNN